MEKQITYLESSCDAEYNGFPFDGDLAEKRPHKH